MADNVNPIKPCRICHVGQRQIFNGKVHSYCRDCALKQMRDNYQRRRVEILAETATIGIMKRFAALQAKITEKAVDSEHRKFALASLEQSKKFALEALQVNPTECVIENVKLQNVKFTLKQKTSLSHCLKI